MSPDITPMVLLVGLGNPGREFTGNRHNIGFMALDAIAGSVRAPPFRARFKGQASELAIGADRAVLLKPETYMNDSGRAVAEAARFYKMPPGAVIVFHDELDLPPGRLRVKTGGGNAGHNGLRSITAAIGNDYRRVRLGIGHPGDKALVHGYVLNDFGKGERAWVEALCNACARTLTPLLAGDDVLVQTRVAEIMRAAGFGEVETLGGKRG